MKKILTFAALTAFAAAMQAQTVTSPDGQVKVDFSLTPSGQPEYEMTYKGKEVIKPSKLGFELMKGKPLKDGFKVASVDTLTFDETWTPVWGEENAIRNHYKEMRVNLEQPATGRKMSIAFRVFNDGMGFRYEFPMQKKLARFTISD